MMPCATKLRLLALAIAVITPCAASAQAKDTLTEFQRFRIYESQKKSSWGAAALEYVVPMAGYAYAGNWKRGIWRTALYLGGVAVASGCLFSETQDCSNEEQETLAAGFTLIFASRIWA